MVAPVKQREGKGRGFGRVEVGGKAGEGDGVKAFGNRGVVGDDQATGGTAEGFVSAHRHQMRAFGQRVGPDAPGDDAALVGGVEQDLGADLIGDLADLCHRVRKQVQAATHRDDLWPDRVGEIVERCKINGIAIGVNRGGVGGQAVKPGTAGGVVRDMAADAAGGAMMLSPGFASAMKP